MTDQRSSEDFERARRTDQAVERLLGELGRDTRATGDAASERWTNDCPSDIGLWHELALGELEAPRARELEAHASSCPMCAADRDLAWSFVEEVDRTESHAPPAEPAQLEVAGSRSGGPWRAVLGLAATVALAFTGLMWLRSSPQDLPAIGGPGSGIAMRSATGVELLAPRGTVDQIPERLSWSSPVEGAEYVVTVQRVDGSVLFERRTTESQVLLSDVEQAALQRDVTYSWFVMVRLDDQRLRTPQSQFVIRTVSREDSP